MKIINLTFLLFIIFFLVNLQHRVYADTSKLSDRDSVEIIVIPAGEFPMGSLQEEGRPDEKPQRKVFLDTYVIDAYEVSNERYLSFIHRTGRKEPPNPYSNGLLSQETGINSLPVVQVTWYDAVDYCRWAGKRLPTEAEWEKAARGNEGLVFPWGSESPSNKHVNFEKNWEGTKTLWTVDTNNGTASPFGLKGMAGNVREWVQDWYAPDYFQTAPQKNPSGPQIGILKVIKGGSWHSFKADLRSASRGKGGFALKTDGIGFRCAK
ncbi:MAG: sulfatase modifying factor 1 [Nitrospinales bacterium]|jgi:sulfatase modifying factor 1